MKQSTAMGETGFVMQILRRKVTQDEAGNQVLGEVHAIQYQVVKVQQLRKAGS